MKPHWKQIVTALSGLALALILMVPAAMAVAPAAFSTERPVDHVIDDADVFSRASRGELETRLQDFEQDRLDARLITLRRLDYGYTLNSFGTELTKDTARLIVAASNEDLVIAVKVVQTRTPGRTPDPHA